MKQKYVTKQEDVTDCGAACLSSIIKYYGGFIPMEKIRMDTLTGNDGTTAYHLLQASSKYGFDVTGLKLENVKNILERMIVLPAIAHIEKEGFNHFVVIYKIDKKKNSILVMDPAFGFKKISLDEFNTVWTKIILILIPQHKIPRYKQSQTVIKLFIDLFKKEKTLLFKIILTVILVTILSIASSFYIKAFLKYSNSNINSFIGLFILITAFKVIFMFIKDRYINFLNQDVDKKIILPFLNHLFLLPIFYVKNKTTGEIITRVRELNNIKNLFSKAFIILFLDLFLTISTIALMYSLNDKLFFILCLVLVVYICINIVLSPKIIRSMDTLISSESAFNGLLVENIDGLESIKNNHQETNQSNRIRKSFLDNLQINFKFNNLLNKMELLKNFVLEIGIFIITTIGLYDTYLDKFNILDLITFNALLLYVLESFKSIASLIPEMCYIKSSFNLVNDFLSLDEEKLISSEENIKNGLIKAENITYSYNNYNYIINNLSFVITPGEHVMLKGKSGCGKSTLCKLLFRSLKLDSGKILIDNKDIAEYELDTIRSNITYSSQKEKLFTDTIKNNILFNKNVSDKEYQDIVKICRVDKIIKGKPMLDNTLIMENGFNLSGGERQRIILARCLLKPSKIIILDEALSEVESEEETLIIKDILNYFSNRTIIYVTHRDKSNLFDRVITLDKGLEKGVKNGKIK